MTRNYRCAILVTGVLLVSLFAVAGAQAAEEGGNSATERASEIFKWINFAIVAGALVWLCVKKGPGFFGSRAELILSEIAAASKAKAEADARLREAEAKLKNLEKEVEDFRALGLREAAAEVERIRSATQADTEKIATAAEAEIEAAARAARMELKAVAANLAVDGAEALLTKQLTAQAQTALITNFVKSLEGRPN